MARKAPLTDPQDRRLKRIAREKGFACPDCGSSEPVSQEGGELKDLPDGGAEIPMRCEACEGSSEMALVLSPEEAEALGLHSLGGGRKRPDVLRNGLLMARTSEDAIQATFAGFSSSSTASQEVTLGSRRRFHPTACCYCMSYPVGMLTPPPGKAEHIPQR